MNNYFRSLYTSLIFFLAYDKYYSSSNDIPWFLDHVWFNTLSTVSIFVSLTAEFLCQAVNSLPIFCITCSTYSMVVLSLERHRSIVHNRKLIKGKLAFAGVFISIWLFSILTSLPTFFEYQIEYKDVMDKETGNTTNILVCHQILGRSFSIGNCFLVLFASYIIPQVILYSTYGRLGYFIWLKLNVQVSAGNSQTNSSSFKAKVKVIKMLVWAATLLTVSWMPYFVIQSITVKCAFDIDTILSCTHMVCFYLYQSI